MSAMGTTIPQFELPVCTSFKPHVIRDRLCYQLDVNKMRENIETGRAMKTGLILALDYNRERSLSDPAGLHKLQESADQYRHATIRIETLGGQIENQTFTSFLSLSSFLGSS